MEKMLGITQEFYILFKKNPGSSTYKTAAVWPLTSHFMNKTCWDCWRSKDKLISDVLFWTPTHGCTSVGQPAKTYIHQIYADTVYYLEDLPGVMDYRDG